MGNFISYELLPIILNMSLTASVVILCVLLARLLLKKAPKVFSYALWAVVLFRLLCPVSINASFSLLGLFDPPAEETTAHTSVVEYVPQDIVHTPYPEVTLPLPTVGDPGVQIIGGTTNSPVNNAPGSNINDIINESLPQGEEQTVADPLEAPMAIATFAWLAGILVMAVYSVISYARLKSRLVGAARLRDNIYLADHIGSPFVMGIFRPKIYLPSSLPEQEQGYILLHEQHHIRRLDHVMKALAFVALCIHWFNPLVWLAFVLSGKDMEMSCDEAVVKKLGENIRADYSASLLSLATGRRVIAGTPLAFGEGDTKSRIKNMLNWKKPKTWIVLLAAVACIGVLAACVTNPKEDTPPDEEQTNEEQSEKEYPTSPLEVFLSDLHGDDIAEVEWLIDSENKPANTEVATLIRKAVKNGTVSHEPLADDSAFWCLSIRIADSGADWDSDDILDLRAGIDENVVEIFGGSNLPAGHIWVEDEDLYRLVRTSMDVPETNGIDTEALALYQDIVNGYLAQIPYAPSIVESARQELTSFYLAAEREDLGAEIYCIGTVTIVEPAEKAPYLLAGGAHVDSQLRIHGANESNLLVVIDGRPMGFVNWMWLELDNGLENCASKDDLFRIVQSFRGSNLPALPQTSGSALTLEHRAAPFTSYDAFTAYMDGYTGFADWAKSGFGKVGAVYNQNCTIDGSYYSYLAVEDGRVYRLPLPYTDMSLRCAEPRNSVLDMNKMTYTYEATVEKPVRADDGSILSNAGTYYYTVDLTTLTYAVRFVAAASTPEDDEFAPTGVVLPEISALLGDWQLDGAYTEAANGVGSLQRNFGASLEQYGASLTIGSDHSFSYYIGTLHGEGTWEPDGDTGRCKGTAALSPGRGEKRLTFYAFRQSSDSATYLAMDYGSYVLYWTQNAASTREEQTTGETIVPDNTPFTAQPIEWKSPLNGTFERTYETQLYKLQWDFESTSPLFMCEQVLEFDACAVVLGSSRINVGGTEDSPNWLSSGAAYILFRDGKLGKLPLPVYSNGVAVLPETVVEHSNGQLGYEIWISGGPCYRYTVDLIARTVTMVEFPIVPADEFLQDAVMENYNGPEVTDVAYPILTAAYHIVSAEQEGDTYTAYAIVNYDTFEWYNGRQKRVPFSWTLPVKMTFERNGADSWYLKEFWCSETPDNYMEDIRKHFPTDIAEQTLKMWDSEVLGELYVSTFESAAAYYATLSGLPEPKVYTPADVNFTGQALNFKEPDDMTYEERLAWVQSGAADSENRAYVSEALYLEGPGILAYICQWVGTPHLGQYVFNLRFADGSTATIPLPKEAYFPSALPDSMEFRDGKFIYEKTFAEELLGSEGDTVIHLKGTYHYEVDLNAKTVSLTVIQ